MVAGTLLLQMAIALILLKLPVARDTLFGLNGVVARSPRPPPPGTSFIFGYMGGGPRHSPSPIPRT